jgi:hypothetical protein
VAKVYLETSFFSACVSTRSDPKTAGWRVTSNEWWETQARHHELFISAEVIAELSAHEFPNRSSAVAMVAGLNVLDLTREIGAFAELLVAERVMPAPANRGDAIHVASATIHEMDYILTWNVKHLANPNKRTHFGIICMRLGLAAPMLITPDLLQETDDE